MYLIELGLKSNSFECVTHLLSNLLRIFWQVNQSHFKILRDSKETLSCHVPFWHGIAPKLWKLFSYLWLHFWT